ncbi:N-formylglutamate amidohydrolase [bacterium]
MTSLPFLISIAHGGEEIPEEIKMCIRLSREEILEDGDAFTTYLFDVYPHCPIVKASIARAFIDLNRAPDALPPIHSDGVIKNQTCFKKPIYKAGYEPDNQLISLLIDKYYHPYYQELKKHASRDIILGLDCHSMAEFAPPISNLSGEKRPLINLGDVNGSACDPEITKRLADCFRKVFNLISKDVSINKPFSGGRISQVFGKKPIPWIQIEINRSLYLKKPWFNSETWEIDYSRLRSIKSLFLKVLKQFVSYT